MKCNVLQSNIKSLNSEKNVIIIVIPDRLKVLLAVFASIPRGVEYSAYWNSNRDGMRYKPIGARV